MNSFRILLSSNNEDLVPYPVDPMSGDHTDYASPTISWDFGEAELVAQRKFQLVFLGLSLHPVLLQSVTKQVFDPNLKDLTPFFTNYTISTFVISNAFWRSSFHANSDFLASNFQNGYIRVDFAKANATWSTNPYHDLMPVMSLGWGKLVMASKVASVGHTLSSIVRVREEVASVNKQLIQSVRPTN